MNRFVAADLIRVWELGQVCPNWQRALVLLGPYFPDHRPSQLSALTVGERNAHLFQLRQSLSGSVIHGFVRCPVCREPLEFGESVAAFLEGYAAPLSKEGHVESDGTFIRFRLLDSRDLAAANNRNGLPEARRELIERSVIEARHNGAPVAASHLSEAAIETLAREISRRDPLSETRVALACVACDHVWKAGFDILSILWTEIDLRAKRLLQDVQVIAREFGWSEREILNMSESRRQYYLGSVS